MRHEAPVHFTIRRRERHRGRPSHPRLDRAVTRFCAIAAIAALALVPGHALIAAIWS